MAQNGIFDEKVAQFRLRELELQRQIAIHEADRKWLLGMQEEAKLRQVQRPQQQDVKDGTDLEHPIMLPDDDDHQDLKKDIPLIDHQVEQEVVISQDQDTNTTSKDSNRTPQQENLWEHLINQYEDTKTTAGIPSRYPQQENLPTATEPNLELEFCQHFLTKLHDEKYDKVASYFRYPVNEELNIAPNYHKIIKNPIALSDILRKLAQGQYTSAGVVKSDLGRMLENCRIYHKHNPDNSVASFEAGKKMAILVGGFWGGKKRWVAAARKKRLSSGTEDPQAVRSRTSSSAEDGIVRDTLKENLGEKRRRLSSRTEDHQTRRSPGRTGNLGSNARDGDIKSFMRRVSVAETEATNDKVTTKDKDGSEWEKLPRNTLQPQETSPPPRRILRPIRQRARKQPAGD